eukprot:4285317-Pleurochrysis_carterae.AAC.1
MCSTRPHCTYLHRRDRAMAAKAEAPVVATLSPAYHPSVSPAGTVKSCGSGRRNGRLGQNTCNMNDSYPLGYVQI